MKTLTKNKYKVRYAENYIIATGDIPVCLIAHLDTVFDKDTFRQRFGLEWFYDADEEVLWSPEGAGFDDRAGVYAILDIIERGYRPHIIFTCGEEVGGIGAYELTDINNKPPFDCKFLIELDRAGYNDSVYYDCDNSDFEKFINDYGFATEIGTFTDISIIAPKWGLAAVNLSIGYIDEHFRTERLHCNILERTIAQVCEILEDVKEKGNRAKKFRYIPAKRDFRRYYEIDAIQEKGLACAYPTE